MVLYLLIISTLFIFLLLYYAYNALNNEKILAIANEEAEKNLDLKNRIIGMLSHEMRAPLTIISNIANKIKNLNNDEILKNYSKNLDFTSKSLQLTVNQILDYFRNENSKLVFYNSSFNLKTEITAIIDSLKTLGQSKKIDFISSIDSNLECMIWADNGKIHQLFYNIIGNAIKFTEKGSITIVAKTSKINNKIRLDVSIKDTGVGIPENDLKNIFDKYYQSEHSSNKISLGARAT